MLSSIPFLCSINQKIRMEISYKHFAPKQPVTFSILIPTWNNLDYLKACILSIRKNSVFNHEIIVHVNEGNDGTIEWLLNQEISYSATAKNAGICKAMNAAASLASAKYYVYMNDDMVCLPNWDKPLIEEISKLRHNAFMLSSTMIEPKDSGNACVLAPYNFGTHPSEFKEEALMAATQDVVKPDWQGASWPPLLVHKEYWHLIGGFSIEFSPGMYSDPDFTMKLYAAGVRYFKGIGSSRVYHFQSRSTGKVKKNNGRRQFMAKWGISAGRFYKNYIQLGGVFKGELPAKQIQTNLLDRFKAFVGI